MQPAYSRVLVKVSGEALMGSAGHGLHGPTIQAIAQDIATAAKAGCQIAVVVGGGNFIRGSQIASQALDRATADSMGMMATVINGMALEKAIEAAGCPARVMSAIQMPTLCESYARQRALDHLDKGRVVIAAGGTGNPFFTTDTAAVLRAAELNCQAVLKATQVDGVYSADPKKDPHAIRFDAISHDEALSRDLKVMDTAAFALARESSLPIVVFSIQQELAITKVLSGQGLFTTVG
jgi:uridylate kinase